jgi:hypothetical protein
LATIAGPPLARRRRIYLSFNQLIMPDKRDFFPDFN